MRNLAWRMSPTDTLDVAAPTPVLIITPKLNEDAGAPALISEHVGSTYQLRSIEPVVTHASGEVWPDDTDAGFSAAANRYWSTRLRPWLRWLMYREPVTPRYSEEIVLWVPWAE
jgi:hypothetical protein